MSVEITWTRIKDAQLRPVLFSGNQEGSLGGETLPVPRLGDRLAYDINTAKLRQDAESRLLIAALFEATTLDARMLIRQPNKSHPGFSGIVVDGVDQSGSVLKLRGVPPYAPVGGRGDFFNVLHRGRRYLYMLAAQVIADAAGRVAVPIWPMLRFLTVDASPCDFIAPVIEGQLVGFDKGAGFESNRTKPLSFSIVERA